MGKVEKISLNEKQMELVTYYSENDMARLKRICNPIINMKNVFRHLMKQQIVPLIHFLQEILNGHSMIGAVIS